MAHKNQNTKSTQILVEGAAITALAAVLSYIRIFALPWGGSITLMSMLPIVLFSIRRGVKKGLTVSALFSLIQFAQGIADGCLGWGLTPAMLLACILLDYLIAFTVLGIAGIFRRRGLTGWIAGIILAIGLRFLCHFVSGVVIWHSFGALWEGFSTENSILYSFLYNACYMLPEMLFTLIGAVALLKSPHGKRILMDDQS